MVLILFISTMIEEECFIEFWCVTSPLRFPIKIYFGSTTCTAFSKAIIIRYKSTEFLLFGC